MKPSTMMAYLGERGALIQMGWNSKASFEVFVQVLLDDIVRTHLSNRVNVWEGEDTKVLVQGDSGKGITAVPTTEWPKMREINYTSDSTKIADEYVANKRFVVDEYGAMNFKNTFYWIELKVESPETNKFGGKTAKNAYDEDWQKLANQAYAEGLVGNPANGSTRRRYWCIMIAFSLGAIGTLGGFTWTLNHTFMLNGATMFVGLREHKA